MKKKSLYNSFIKRCLDIVISLSGLILLSPVFAVTAVLVRIKLGSPVIFRQTRTGRINPATGTECQFTIYKFRTMSSERNAKGRLLPDRKRLGSFGKVLRDSSLDELPELWNVLRGDMSLVGPRPLLVEYLPLYTPEQRRRHDVRPGITGLAQICGRNAISWEEKFEHDIEYVNDLTFRRDVRIFFATFSAVFRRVGINAKGETTVAPFRGTPGAQSAATPDKPRRR